MAKHNEKTFEDEVIAHLISHGWLLGTDTGYDRALALYPEDVLGWLQDTQPTELAKLQKLHNGDTDATILKRLAEVLDTDGALKVLRKGFKHINASFAMSESKPATTLNPATLTRYAQVRCRVVRQVHYSLHTQNSIDLVLFVNGIPVATLELKTDFTQNGHEAIAQYRYDRLPRDPVAKQDEPLLAFKRRALVHFAVSTDEVWMATHLKGKDTRFLPFNMGNDGGAGNPPNPDGYRTAYLWERVLSRDSLLTLISSFVHLAQEKDDAHKVKGESLIFPRFHQWDGVNAVVADAQQAGPGQSYLIQHSAGSGKSNTIAWLTYRLASLYDAQDRKVFDTIIVVTDRTVLDKQLQDTIEQFDRTTGVLVSIKDEGASKSKQLLDALRDKKQIIIVTLQTFPFVLDAIRKETSLKDRTFAVIADEAHSSQTGAASSALSKVLTAEQVAEGEEVSAEDIMLADMEQRAEHRSISYVALTATPKAKTILRFGTRPDPTRPPSDSNMPAAFHTYTMQQAIEEGYILDILQNYLSYKVAFKLAHNGQEYDDTEVDQGQALKGLMRWVRLHPYNIAQKVAIIVEHFRENVQAMLGGHAKAMVVTGSRKEAVRYKLGMDAYIRDHSYANLATLVAFSGEVHDSDSGPTPFSEHAMNTGLKGRDIRDAFKTDEYQVLIVANKYQTGFDQPLLCAMYVDKRLDGITAVQTLSRLNRTAPGKDRTFILDFVNEPEDILAAFQPYYRQAELANVTDPNLIHTLQAKLDDAGIYTDSEIATFVTVYVNPKGTQKALQGAIAPAVERFRVRWREARDANNRQALDELELFRKDMQSFVRLYDFLSQVINYGDTDLEGRAIFFRHLLPLLATERVVAELDLSSVQLTHYKLKDKGQHTLDLKTGTGDTTLAAPSDVGSGTSRDAISARLSAIVEKMNQLFEGDLKDADVLAYATHIRDKLLENPKLAQQAASNSKEQFALGDFQNAFMQAVVSGLGSYKAMATQVLSQPHVKDGFGKLLLDLVYEAFQAE